MSLGTSDVAMKLQLDEHGMVKFKTEKTLKNIDDDGDSVKSDEDWQSVDEKDKPAMVAEVDEEPVAGVVEDHIKAPEADEKKAATPDGDNKLDLPGDKAEAVKTEEKK